MVLKSKIMCCVVKNLLNLMIYLRIKEKSSPFLIFTIYENMHLNFEFFCLKFGRKSVIDLEF